jgi:NAD(P)-dependent dehydrogenase (short-subunit alcohol dehydrogenase family)
MSLLDIKDKVVIITGGNQNIGLNVAKGLAELGAKIAVGDLSKNTAKDLYDYFENNTSGFLWHELDVSSKDSVDKFFEAVMCKFGRVDALFNNAGVRVGQTALEHDAEKWDWLFDINVKGTMLCCQAAAKIMKKQGYGRIVNTSSISAYKGQLMRSSYCASKGAVSALTAALTVEWAHYGININAVAWGGVDIEQTPLEKMNDGQKATYAMTPMKKLAGKDSLVGPVAFLISDAAQFINGQTILVDGGWSVLGKPDLSEL